MDHTAHLDALIEACHARDVAPAPNDPASREACELMEIAGTILVISMGLPDVESAEPKAAFFEYDAEPERLEEIRAGAPLDAEEERSWGRHTEDFSDQIEGVAVVRAAHSRDPSLLAYAAVGDRQAGQGRETTGWAGPAADIGPLLPLVAEKARECHEVFVDDLSYRADTKPDADRDRVVRLVEEAVAAPRGAKDGDRS